MVNIPLPAKSKINNRLFENIFMQKIRVGCVDFISAAHRHPGIRAWYFMCFWRYINVQIPML